MSRRQRYVSVFLALVALLALGYVVAVASQSRPGGVGEESLFEIDRRFNIDLGGLFAWLIFILAIVGAALLVFGIKEMKPKPREKKRNYLGLVLAVIVFLLIFQFFQPVAENLLDAAGGGESADPGSGQGASTPGPVAWLFSLLVAAVVAAALTRVGMTVRESIYDGPEDPAPPRGAVPAPKASPTVLPLASDPKSRVLSAYHRFERAAAERGHERRSNETANRHSRRVATELGLTGGDLIDLMSSFSRTRFGFGPVTDADAENAEAASDRLRREMSP